MAKFIGLQNSGLKALPPDQLVGKWIPVLRSAQRYMSQMSDQEMQGQVIPNRERAIWRLCFHIFRIAEAYLEAAVDGVDFIHQLANIEPPPGKFTTSKEIVGYGDGIIARINRWWEANADKACSRKVETYFGTQSLHLLLERCTWHSTQHTRQLMSVIERLGHAPNEPLTTELMSGLPLPARLWE